MLAEQLLGNRWDASANVICESGNPDAVATAVLAVQRFEQRVGEYPMAAIVLERGLARGRD